MTRLIDNMERQHLVVRISDKKDRRTNLIHLTKTARELEGKARFIANKTLKEALQGITFEELRVSQDVLRKRNIHQHQRLKFFKVFFIKIWIFCKNNFHVKELCFNLYTRI